MCQPLIDEHISQSWPGASQVCQVRHVAHSVLNFIAGERTTTSLGRRCSFFVSNKDTTGLTAAQRYRSPGAPGLNFIYLSYLGSGHAREHHYCATCNWHSQCVTIKRKVSEKAANTFCLDLTLTITGLFKPAAQNSICKTCFLWELPSFSRNSQHSSLNWMKKNSVKNSLLRQICNAWIIIEIND